MLSFYNDKKLSIGIKLFIASGIIRVLIILVVLLCLWIAILWASILP